MEILVDLGACMSAVSDPTASYLIGVYSKRNLCFVAGRRTTLSCLNQDFSMPNSLTKSMSVPTMPSMDSLLSTIAGVGSHSNPETST